MPTEKHKHRSHKQLLQQQQKQHVYHVQRLASLINTLFLRIWMYLKILKLFWYAAWVVFKRDGCFCSLQKLLCFRSCSLLMTLVVSVSAELWLWSEGEKPSLLTWIEARLRGHVCSPPLIPQISLSPHLAVFIPPSCLLSVLLSFSLSLSVSPLFVLAIQLKEPTLLPS